MTYISMTEAWEIDDLCRHYPSDYDCLPDYPEEVSHSELMKAQGFEDAKSYMKGELDNPEHSDDIDYMIGWNEGLDNFFINQELFGERLDNSLEKS